MKIDLKPRNPLSECLHKSHSKAEDLLFSIVQHLPVVPSFLANWLERYMDKRIAELQQETIKQQWDKISLEQVVDDIHDRQQDKRKSTFRRLILSSVSAFLILFVAIMIPTCQDVNIFLINLINQAIFIVDSSTPETSQVSR